jgi:phage gpG-like protein
VSNAFDIEISGDAQALIPRLKDDPGLGRAIAREMDYQNQLTVAQIQRGHLSGPTTDSSLSVRTNRLRGSVRASSAVATGTGVVSSIGSNVVYAAAHEFGALIHHPARSGSVRLRTDRNGQLLRNGNLAIFAAGRHKRAVTRDYKAEAYDVTIPARAPFGHGIADRAEEYGQGISSAIVNYWEGKN